MIITENLAKNFKKFTKESNKTWICIDLDFPYQMSAMKNNGSKKMAVYLRIDSIKAHAILFADHLSLPRHERMTVGMFYALSECSDLIDQCDIEDYIDSNQH